MSLNVRRADPSDAAAVVRVLHAALADDPFVSWLVADRPRARLAYVRLMVEEIAMPRGRVDVAERAGEILGAALWAPPHTFALNAWDSIRLMPRMIGIIGLKRMSATSAKLEQVEAARPAEPYWLLTLLGAAPEHRRQGVGSGLLAPVLARCDADGLPAACETAADHNVTFYRRHGFEVTAERALGAEGPTSFSLRREPSLADPPPR